jgi:hypothetical protein
VAAARRARRIETQIVPSARLAKRSPARLRRELCARLDAGAEFVCAGLARRAPGRLIAAYPPRAFTERFGTGFYLSAPRQNEDIRFVVAYLVPDFARRDAPIFARLFYKDVSLIWRAASHFIRSAGENWIGKGDVHVVDVGDEELETSAEETTDLPLELQDALEEVSSRAVSVPHDRRAVEWVLRRAPDRRIRAYRDFTEPRRRAQSNPANLVNRGRPIAQFTRAGDPGSLRFAKGYEPDFERGVLERSSSTSRLYGGRLRRYRIVSRNRRIQYLFFAGPKQVWIIPPQALTTELSTYGVRTIDVAAPEELCIPGFEYHFREGGDPEGPLVSQIPAGHVGAQSERDPARADASPWNERLPVIREFRRRILKR